MSDFERALAVKNAALSRLLAIPGVHSVGIGPKLKNGERTGDYSIVVWVTRKMPLADVPPDQVIPAEIDGVKTDVVEHEVPIIHRSGDKSHPAKEDGSTYDPLLGGCRVQLQRTRSDGAVVINEGTLGCLVTTTGTLPGIPAGMVVGLTCHHVMYDCGPDAGIGRNVGQPTPADSCSKCCSDIIGRALKGKLILDGALIALKPQLKYQAEVTEIGPISGSHEVEPGEIPVVGPDVYRVRKRGFRSGLTIGQIVSVEHSGSINDHDGNFCHTYGNALAIVARDPQNTPFAVPGDSGSAIVNDANQVVGIYFGGTPLSALATKISDLELELGIDVQTAAQAGVVKTVPVVANDPVFKLAALGLAEAPAGLVDAGLARLLVEAQAEVIQTPQGKEVADLVQLHHEEVLSLISANRKVAAVWEHYGGPQLIQSLLRMVQFRDQPLPGEINGRPLPECLTSIQRTLARYASPALADALRQHLPRAGQLAGLSYPQILTALQAPGGA